MELPKKILNPDFLKSIQDTILNKDKKAFKEILFRTLTHDEAVDCAADLSDIIDRLHFVKDKKRTPLLQQFNIILNTSKNLATFNKILLYRIKVAKYYIHNYRELLKE